MNSRDLAKEVSLIWSDPALLDTSFCRMCRCGPAHVYMYLYAAILLVCRLRRLQRPLHCFAPILLFICHSQLLLFALPILQARLAEQRVLLFGL